MFVIEKLPYHYKWGQYLRIGPDIYQTIFSFGNWHFLRRLFN